MDILLITAKSISSRYFFKNAHLLNYTIEYVNAISKGNTFKKVIVGSNDFHEFLDESWECIKDEDEHLLIDSIQEDITDHCKIIKAISNKFNADNIILFQGSNPLREYWLVDEMLSNLKQNDNIATSTYYKGLDKNVSEEIDGCLFGWTKKGIENSLFNNYHKLLHNSECRLDCDFGFESYPSQILDHLMENCFRLRKPLPFLGKSICLVGSSNSLEGKKLGKIIDEHDYVIRVNWSHIQKEDTGEKFDFWATSHPQILHHNEDVRYKPLILLRDWVNDSSNAELINYAYHYHHTLIRRSSGFMALDCVSKYNPSKISICGYGGKDFIEKIDLKDGLQDLTAIATGWKELEDRYLKQLFDKGLIDILD